MNAHQVQQTHEFSIQLVMFQTDDWTELGHC